MSQIELYFVSALVGSVSLILLRKKIKKIIGWIMGWTDGSSESSEVRLLWVFHGTHTLGMDKDGNLVFPKRGEVYWRRHHTETKDVYKFSCKPADTEYYLVEQFGHHANQVWGQRTMDNCWFQHIIDPDKNEFLLQSYNDDSKVELWKDGRFFVIKPKRSSNNFAKFEAEFKLDDYSSALKYGRFIY